MSEIEPKKANTVAHKKGKESPITFKLREDGKCDFAVTEGCNIVEAVEQLVGTQQTALLSEIIARGVGALPRDHSEEHKFNLIFQTLADSQPKDVMEARLFLQANALYAQGMKYLQRAEATEMMCNAEHYMKFALKLLRLHNETIEALNRYRRGGEQKVIVQHVNVNDGGKAVVGGSF